MKTRKELEMELLDVKSYQKGNTVSYVVRLIRKEMDRTMKKEENDEPDFFSPLDRWKSFVALVELLHDLKLSIRTEDTGLGKIYLNLKEGQDPMVMIETIRDHLVKMLSQPVFLCYKRSTNQIILSPI